MCSVKNRLIKLSALFIAAFLLSVSVFRADKAFAQEEDTSSSETAVTDSDDEEYDTQTPLPAKYDPRPDGVSRIREQIWGTCWAQAGISTFESWLISQGIEDNDIQLSVEDVLWWAQDSWVMRSRGDGGRSASVTGYLQTVGARSEEDIPYLDAPAEEDDYLLEFYGMGRNQRPENYDTAPVLYEVTDMIFFTEAEPEEIKALIMKYGAVSTLYRDSVEQFNEKTSAIWDRYDEKNEANHAVSVIGWDDDYPKENFLEVSGHLPENDGAWIIKNSYGENYGSDGGFTYISYEDEYIFKNCDPLEYSYCIAGAREPEDQNCYLTDQNGAVSFMAFPEEENAVWANVYEFGEDEQITEVSFVTWTKSGTYQVYYAPLSEDAPDADMSSWTLLSEGELEHAGYMTVPSEWEEAVPEGKGAIILSITGESPSIGTEEPLYRDGSRTLYNPIHDRGSAFMLKDGNFVTAEIERTISEDFSHMEKPDISLRAYTKAISGD